MELPGRVIVCCQKEKWWNSGTQYHISILYPELHPFYLKQHVNIVPQVTPAVKRGGTQNTCSIPTHSVVKTSSGTWNPEYNNHVLLCTHS